jgi:hypothetical protein
MQNSPPRIPAMIPTKESSFVDAEPTAPVDVHVGRTTGFGVDVGASVGVANFVIVGVVDILILDERLVGVVVSGILVFASVLVCDAMLVCVVVAVDATIVVIVVLVVVVLVCAAVLVGAGVLLVLVRDADVFVTDTVMLVGVLVCAAILVGAGVLLLLVRDADVLVTAEQTPPSGPV